MREGQRTECRFFWLGMVSNWVCRLDGKRQWDEEVVGGE